MDVVALLNVFKAGERCLGKCSLLKLRDSSFRYRIRQCRTKTASFAHHGVQCTSLCLARMPKPELHDGLGAVYSAESGLEAAHVSSAAALPKLRRLSIAPLDPTRRQDDGWRLEDPRTRSIWADHAYGRETTNLSPRQKSYLIGSARSRRRHQICAGHHRLTVSRRTIKNESTEPLCGSVAEDQDSQY